MAIQGSVCPLIVQPCDVVLSNVAQEQVPQLERFLQLLGEQIYSPHEGDERPASPMLSPITTPASEAASVFTEGAIPMTRGLELAMNELVVTERHYVARLEALFSRYAVPLRQLAKDRDTQIIPTLEAERIFGNLGDILAANKLLLCELEMLHEQGPAALAAGVGDVLSQNMRMFACYDVYLSGFEVAQQTYNAMLKRKGFREFIEHSTPDLGNVGLRELMVEPMQRIPRYQLLIANMLKHMPPACPQAQRLRDASESATHIASRRATNSERAAAVLWSCQRAIERFPIELLGTQRTLLGCIDVDEPGASEAPRMFASIGSVLTGRARSRAHSLLVFDDVLLLVQRHSTTPTHQLLGVQEPDKLADMMRSAQIAAPPAPRRTELTFAGMADLADVAAQGTGATELQLDLLRPLRGTSNKVPLRRFVDVLPENPKEPRIALFLDCLWRAQAIHRARAQSLAVRTGAVPRTLARGSCALFWTVLTGAQYARIAPKNRVLVHIGAMDDARHQVECCVGLELHADAPLASVTLAKNWGAELSCFDIALENVPVLCADALQPSTEPVALSARPTSPVAEPPVRRAQSQRETPRRVPHIHRTRSLMSERARASIQTSLAAVEHEQRERQASRSAEVPPDDDAPADMEITPRKRAMPLGDIGNVSPKRRAVARNAPGAENVPLVTVEEPSADSKAALMDEDAEISANHLLDGYLEPSMDAEEAAQPPAAEPPMQHAPPATPTPGRLETLVEVPEMDEGDSSTATLKQAASPEPVKTPALADTTEVHPRNALHMRADETLDLPNPYDASADHAPAPAPAAAAATPAEPIKTSPPRPLSRSEARQVTEEEMQDMLRPLLDHLQSSPQPQQVVHHEAVPVMRAEQAQIVSPDSVSEVPPPVPHKDTAADTSDGMFDGAAEDAPAPPNECSEMRRAVHSLNDCIRALRRHRPSTQSLGWVDDWNGFKQAVKTMNVSWTHMERAYENKQMELAAQRLAQREANDDHVTLTREQLHELQDQTNAVLPLRLQIEQLTKRNESLAELERDARLENAELYDVFNEELSKLFQHSFRPANEEIETLRKALQSAKTELHSLRIENRRLRLECALADS